VNGGHFACEVCDLSDGFLVPMRLGLTVIGAEREEEGEIGGRTGTFPVSHWIKSISTMTKVTCTGWLPFESTLAETIRSAGLSATGLDLHIFHSASMWATACFFWLYARIDVRYQLESLAISWMPKYRPLRIVPCGNKQTLMSALKVLLVRGGHSTLSVNMNDNLLINYVTWQLIDSIFCCMSLSQLILCNSSFVG